MIGEFDSAIKTLLSASLTYGHMKFAMKGTFGPTGSVATDIAGMAVADLRNAILRNGAGVPGYTPYKVSAGWAATKRRMGWGSQGYYATGSLLSSIKLLAGGRDTAFIGVDPTMSVPIIPGGSGNVPVIEYATSLDKKHMLLSLSIADFISRKGPQFGQVALDAFGKEGSQAVMDLCRSDRHQQVRADVARAAVKQAIRMQGVKFGYSMDEINKSSGVAR